MSNHKDTKTQRNPASNSRWCRLSLCLRVFVVLCLLTVCAQFVFARQAGDGLNEQQRLGRQLVAQSCGVCHLPPARNAKTYGPVLTKAAGGGDESVVREYITNGTPRMPSFKYFLQPAEIDAIIAYLKTVPAPQK